MKDLSFYVHIPFCVRRCPYCSFYHIPAAPALQTAFAESLHDEVEETLGAWRPPLAVRTVFFGGGSPSVLSEECWQRIFSVLDPYLSEGVTEEVSCELNPEDVNERALEFFERNGVNRVSLGIQSMDPKAQKILARCSPPANTRAVGLATGRFKNVNCDVLLGIPESPKGALGETMKRLADFAPAHFSVYCLEPGGVLSGEARDFLAAVDQERSADEYMFVCEYLGSLGYHHYEVSNFALPGFESLHNRRYWDGSEYVGLGPGAHSFVDGKRYSNLPSLETYLSRGSPETLRVYDVRDAAAVETERIMLALRTDRGVPIEWTRCKETAFRDIVEHGLGRVRAGRLILTEKGYLVLNDIVLRLVG